MDDNLKLAAFLILTFLFLPAFLLFVIFKPESGMLIFYLISGLLALLGIFIFMGKGMWLVAGFNTMSSKEKEEFENKYDVKKFQKTLGTMLLLLSTSFLLFMTNLPFFIPFSLIFGIVLVFIIIMNVFQDRFLKK
jgi:hypothetical protein